MWRRWWDVSARLRRMEMRVSVSLFHECKWMGELTGADGVGHFSET